MGMLSGFAEGLNASFKDSRKRAQAAGLLGMDNQSIIPSIPTGQADQSAVNSATDTLSAIGVDTLKNKFPIAWKVAQAIGAIESGGNYNASGPTVHGQNAMGKYQVMPQNLPSWSKEALGSSISPEEFKKDPELQDRIAVYKMQAYLNQGYSPQDVASMWFSGKPLKGNKRADLATGIAVPEYVQRFNKHYQATEV